MEIKLEKDVTNRLLNRREMVLYITYKGSTPSRAEIISEAARELNLNQENVVVVSIGQLYGAGRSKVLIHEYTDKEAKAIAQKHTLSRPNPNKKQKEKEEAKGEAKKSEAPKEKEQEAKEVKEKDESKGDSAGV